MSITVTATQGASHSSNGILLRVLVLDGANISAPAGNAATNISFSGSVPQVSLTTTVVGSYVFGAIVHDSSGSDTALAINSPWLNDISDTTNNEQYIALQSAAATVTPGANTYGSSTSFSSKGGALAAVEILPGSGGVITTDASSPAAASTTSATTITTASFSPPGGTLLVAIVASDGAGIQTMTVSGGGLTWTQRVFANPSTGDVAAVYTAVVPTFANRAQAVRARLPRFQFAPGRASWNSGSPAQIPPAPTTGPPFYPVNQAIRSRIALPFPRGRAGSSAGAPVRNPTPGPVFRASIRAIRAAFPLPPRGRAAGNPGSRVTVAPPAAAYALKGPVRIRPSLLPRGRASGNPGAPVRNPGKGPLVYPQKGPAGLASRAPGPFRKGSVLSNPGSPVKNPVASSLRFRFGSVYLQWETGTPSAQWETGTPEAG